MTTPHRLEGATIEPIDGRCDLWDMWNPDGTPNYERIEQEIASGNLRVVALRKEEA